MPHCIFTNFVAQESISTLVFVRRFLWSSEKSIAATEKFQNREKDADTTSRGGSRRDSGGDGEIIIGG